MRRLRRDWLGNHLCLGRQHDVVVGLLGRGHHAQGETWRSDGRGAGDGGGGRIFDGRGCKHGNGRIWVEIRRVPVWRLPILIPLVHVRLVFFPIFLQVFILVAFLFLLFSVSVLFFFLGLSV